MSLPVTKSIFNDLISKSFILPESTYNIVANISAFLIDDGHFIRRDNDIWGFVPDLRYRLDMVRFSKRAMYTQDMINILCNQNNVRYIVVWRLPVGYCPNIEYIISQLCRLGCVAYDIGFIKKHQRFILSRSIANVDHMTDISCEDWNLVNITMIGAIYNVNNVLSDADMAGI